MARSAPPAYQLPVEDPPRRPRPWTVRQDTRPAAPLPLRRFDLRWLDEHGALREASRNLPALPPFEEAAAAFAHGTPLATREGTVAVEDLEPGMDVRTTDGFAPLLWIGSMVLGRTLGRGQVLYRVAAEAFGPARPDSDLLLGPSARLLARASPHRGVPEQTLTPLGHMVDGTSVIAVRPPSEQRLYHLGFASHEIVVVGGLEFESHFPSPLVSGELSQVLVDRYLELLPHLRPGMGFARPKAHRLPLAMAG